MNVRGVSGTGVHECPGRQGFSSRRCGTHVNIFSWSGMHDTFTASYANKFI